MDAQAHQAFLHLPLFPSTQDPSPWDLEIWDLHTISKIHPEVLIQI